jgi:hypothetical protein
MVPDPFLETAVALVDSASPSRRERLDGAGVRRTTQSSRASNPQSDERPNDDAAHAAVNRNWIAEDATATGRSSLSRIEEVEIDEGHWVDVPRAKPRNRHAADDRRPSTAPANRNADGLSPSNVGSAASGPLPSVVRQRQSASAASGPGISRHQTNPWSEFPHDDRPSPFGRFVAERRQN